MRRLWTGGKSGASVCWQRLRAAGLVLCCAAGLAAAEPAQQVSAAAGSFSGFFAFAPTPEPQLQPDMAAGDLARDDVCVTAIGRAERAHGIPQNLLLAIGLQEAGIRRGGQTTIWPWSVNSEGAGYTFASRREALAFVQSERAAGKSSIDIGCLQVNLLWHPNAFASVDAGFDPQRNADYAAAFLSRLYQESGDWMRAVGNYHSRTPEYHKRYLAGVEANLAFIGGTKPGAIATASGAAGRKKASKSAVKDDSLDDILGAFALNSSRQPAKAGKAASTDLADASATMPPEAASAPDPGWGARDGAALSIYSGQSIQPVLSGLANFPDA